jgi:hypothetical protein
MTPETLLRELETLSHDARMRRMVELGRDAKSAPLVSELARGDFYQRLLAIQWCYGSGDVTIALAALTDASRTLRGRAIGPVARFADDAQARHALHVTAGRFRLALLSHLRDRGRFEPIDAFLGDLAERGDPALGSLLPFGSEDAVRRQFDRGAGGSVFWSRLSRHHPRLAAEKLNAAGRAADEADARLVWQVNAALHGLVKTAPDHALAVVAAVAKRQALGRLPLQPLADRRPGEIASLLLGTEDQVHVALDHVADRIPADRLLALLERRPHTLAQRHVWFKRLEPSLRGRVFRAYGNVWRAPDGRHPPWLLTQLPGRLRDQETRRHLKLPDLAAEPEQLIPFLSFLPWDEARERLDAWLSHPEPELRSAALTALVAAGRFHCEHLADLLAEARHRKNEQDPVRRAMLAALAELPPGRWQAEHLDDLGQVIRDALDAADLSRATGALAERLVVLLLPHHPSWAAEWLQTLVRERGRVEFSNFTAHLTDDDVRHLAPALQPVVEAWADRRRREHLLGLAVSLGVRLTAFPGLCDLLERLLLTSRSEWFCDAVLDLFALHDRPRFARVAVELVERDASCVLQDRVLAYLHRRRTDLLTPFLKPRRYRGRFGTGKMRVILPITKRFFRWTPTQQITFAAGVEKTTHRRDVFRAIGEVQHAIRVLAEMQAIDPKRTIVLATKAKPAVRDTALRALGRLDAGQGVPTLLEALDDERARIAIYALRPALLALPPAAALEQLRAVSLRKVTVAKEVVRLVGELPSEVAFPVLQEFDGRKLHRDVRVALLRALWPHLERPEAWAILERAASSADPALLTNAVRIPADRLSEGALRNLSAFLGRLLEHPDAAVRTRVLRRCVELPVTDPDRSLLGWLVRAMRAAAAPERAAAANAVLACATPRDAMDVGWIVREMLPDRRPLTEFVHTLMATLPPHRGRLLPLARAVLRVMTDDPLTATLRARLAVAALPWTELPELFAAMARSEELHAESLTAAAVAIVGAARSDESPEELEAALAGKRDERLRRLALAALIEAAQRAPGWDEERLTRLRLFQADRSPLVAEAAQYVFPPEEPEPR